MVRDGGLGHAGLFNNIGHAQLPAATDAHDLLSGFVSQGLGKHNGTHRAIIYRHLSICQDKNRKWMLSGIVTRKSSF